MYRIKWAPKGPDNQGSYVADVKPDGTFGYTDVVAKALRFTFAEAVTRLDMHHQVMTTIKGTRYSPHWFALEPGAEMGPRYEGRHFDHDGAGRDRVAGWSEITGRYVPD